MAYAYDVGSQPTPHRAAYESDFGQKQDRSNPPCGARADSKKKTRSVESVKRQDPPRSRLERPRTSRNSPSSFPETPTTWSSLIRRFGFRSSTALIHRKKPHSISSSMPMTSS